VFSSRPFNPSRVRRYAANLLLFTLSLAGSGSLLAATPAGDDKALKEALRDDLEHYLCTRSSIEHISTLSMSISFRGDPEDIKLAVGTTQYGGGERVTPSNVFQIGSNTKSFTAAIILKLEADGVLSIDDTVGKWLPQYPAWSKATIRELLNMTSGIPTYDATPAWEADISNDPYAKSTLEQLVAYVYPTLHQPGQWEYSNTGYILAQMIIDKASWWHSYQAELDRLFTENNLRNTFYEPYFYPAAVNRRLVSGYYVNTDDPGLAKLLGMDTKNFSLGWTQAAGGIIATPKDLTTWVRELFEGGVLPRKQRKELLSLVAIPGGEPIKKTSDKHPQGFGLGIFQITAPPLGLFWGYEGSTLGYRAAYAYLPDSGLIITVFTNSQAPAAESTVNTVLFAKLYETLKCFGKI
jgi:D-alanyl-D-alanine carboxypeptidase